MDKNNLDCNSLFQLYGHWIFNAVYNDKNNYLSKSNAIQTIFRILYNCRSEYNIKIK